MSEFKLWSKINPSAKDRLKPNLGIRSLDECDKEDRKIILKHFINKRWFNDKKTEDQVGASIRKFSEQNKANNFCPKILAHGGPHFEDYGIRCLQDCCKEPSHSDFWFIFLNQSNDVVLELLSYYINELTDDEKKKFRNCFNDMSDQFVLNIVMIEDQFLPRQEGRIISEVYEPALLLLSDTKWQNIDRIFSDAISEYRKNTPQGYSNCVTNIVSVIQGFLQIIVNGKIGKGDISNLIPEAQKRDLIPNDIFTTEIFRNIESIFARERQDTSTAHPKKQYANEKNARTMMNLAMIFIQHCLQK